jgi:hypothetical protein
MATTKITAVETDSEPVDASDMEETKSITAEAASDPVADSETVTRYKVPASDEKGAVAKGKNPNTLNGF